MGIAMKGSSLLLVFFLLSLTVLSSACSQRDKQDEIAVRINDYTLTANEFQALFYEYEEREDTPENRAEFLNHLITQKLLLGEGQRRGLDTQKEFLRSIERFWEQSLLKLVVDQKVKELAGRIAVTDLERESAYRKWLEENPGASQPLEEVRDLIDWRIRRTKEAQAMEEWTNELIREAEIKVDKRALGIE